MLSVRCPNPSCAAAYQFPDNLRGRKAKCKQCGTILVLSSAGEPATTPSPKGSPNGAHAELGRFQIRQKLGAGAFGTVYRAYDPQLEREVALKVPQPAVLESAKRQERFAREAKAAARLRHPNIVPVYDVGTSGEHLYIASAFVEGKPLADAVEEKGVDPRRAARIVAQLAEALGYAHGLGIVHRDVKPANVMLDADDRPHLMDFGLAARLDSTEKLTHDGAVLGTPAYMAPEQAAGQKGEARPASDQYSLGVVLYELLCGQTPFQGPPPVVLHNVLHTPPPRLHTLRKDVPRDLETVCMKAMAREPSDRYPDCAAFAADLRRWLEGEPIIARRLGFAERLTRWCNREPRLAAAAGALGVCLAVITVLLALLAGRLSQQLAEARDEAEAVQATMLAGLVAEKEKLDAAFRGQEADVMARARAGVERDDPDEALGLLDRVPADRRGWDWHMVAALAERGPDAVKLLPGHQGPAVGLAFAADSQRLVTAGQAGDVKAWDVWTGREAVNRPFAAGGPGTTALSGDGKRLAVSAQEYLTWPPTPTPPLTVTLQGLLAEGQRQGPLLAASALLACNQFGMQVPGPSTVTVADVATAQPVTKLTLPPAHDLTLALDGTGQRLAAVHRTVWDGPTSVTVWDADTGREVFALPAQPGEPPVAALRPDGRQLAVARFDANSRKSKVELWDLDEKQVAHTVADLPGLVGWLRFSPDGSRLAGSVAGAVNATEWVPYSVCVPQQVQKEIVTTRKVAEPVTKNVEKDGKKIPVIEMQYRDEQVKQLVTETVLTCETHVRGVPRLRGDGPAVVRVWEVASGTAVVTLPARAADGAFAADGQRFATVRAADACGNDSIVQLWELPGGRLLLQLPAPVPSLALVALSPDGKHLAATAANSQFAMPAGMSYSAHTLSHPGRQRNVPEAFVGHTPEETGPVEEVAFGRRTTPAVPGHPIILWSLVPRTHLLAQLPGEGGPVTGLSFSPDGALLASHSACNQRGKVWDVVKNEPRYALAGVASGLWFAKERPWLVNVSPNPAPLTATCSAGMPSAPRRWARETGDELKYPDSVGELLAVSPDGRQILTRDGGEPPSPGPMAAPAGDPSRPIRLRDAETGAEVCALRGPLPPFATFSFSPDGGHVVAKVMAYGYSGSLTAWDAHTGAVKLNDPRPVLQSAVSPDGRWLAAALAPHPALAPHGAPPEAPKPVPPQAPASTREETAAVLLASNSPVPVVLTAQEEPRPVPIEPGPREAKPYQVVLWDLTSGKEVRTLTGSPGFAHGMLFSGDGKALVVVENYSNVIVWDVATGEERLRHGNVEPGALALSPDGAYLALVTGNADSPAPPLAAPGFAPAPAAVQQEAGDLGALPLSFVQLVEGQAGPAPTPVPPPAAEPTPIFPTPQVTPASNLPAITVWDLRTGKSAAVLHGHTAKVHVAAFSLDGRRLVSAGGAEQGRGEVKVWDVVAGRRVGSYGGHTGPVYAAVFSPDGRRVATGGQDRTVRVWSVPGMDGAGDE